MKETWDERDLIRGNKFEEELQRVQGDAELKIKTLKAALEKKTNYKTL